MSIQDRRPTYTDFSSFSLESFDQRQSGVTNHGSYQNVPFTLKLHPTTRTESNPSIHPDPFRPPEIMISVQSTVLLFLPWSKAFLSQWDSPNHHGTLSMVRNIDLPEVIVFYGVDSILDPEQGILRRGVSQLLKDCHEIGTPVIVLSDTIPTITLSCPVHITTRPAPNPYDLFTLLNQQILVQPRGFGGSSGFGRQRANPERPPLMQHVVVLCTTADQCRAARYCGTRCVSLTDHDWADAVLDSWEDMTVDDISTPGSYWLNPPQPKDDDGNRVDIYHIIEWYKYSGNDNQVNSTIENEELEISQSDMDTILADLDQI